jgi:hypothetical protein
VMMIEIMSPELFITHLFFYGPCGGGSVKFVSTATVLLVAAKLNARAVIRRSIVSWEEMSEG